MASLRLLRPVRNCEVSQLTTIPANELCEPPGPGDWHQLFSLFRLLTLIFEAARRVHRLWRLGRRFLQCRRALAHVFEMTLVRHRLDEEVAHRPDQRIDPGFGRLRRRPRAMRVRY